jgi:hypothetical protein
MSSTLDWKKWSSGGEIEGILKPGNEMTAGLGDL